MEADRAPSCKSNTSMNRPIQYLRVDDFTVHPEIQYGLDGMRSRLEGCEILMGAQIKGTYHSRPDVPYCRIKLFMMIPEIWRALSPAQHVLQSLRVGAWDGRK